MKSVIRYHPSLFVSLLIAYSQLFAPFNEDFHPFVTHLPGSDHYESQLSRTSALQILGVYEERDHEEERLSKKKTEPLNFHPAFGGDFRFDIALTSQVSPALNTFSTPDLPGSPYLLYCVLRL